MKVKITESTNFNNPSLERPHIVEIEGAGKGIQKIWRFKNNFGASAVRFSLGTYGGSYGAEKGLWELAVIHFIDDERFEIKYDTGITEDVIGYLTKKEVENYLKKIKKLK
ncbi:MAG: hypothetical protein ACTSXD_11715 [Candidatus Heimdallarchaeaceae archaeon]